MLNASIWLVDKYSKVVQYGPYSLQQDKQAKNLTKQINVVKNMKRNIIFMFLPKNCFIVYRKQYSLSPALSLTNAYSYIMDTH